MAVHRRRQKLVWRPWLKGVFLPSVRLPVAIDRPSYEALTAAGLQIRVTGKGTDRLYIDQITLPIGWFARPLRGVASIGIFDPLARRCAIVVASRRNYMAQLYALPRFAIWEIYTRDCQVKYEVLDRGHSVFLGTTMAAAQQWLASSGYINDGDPRLYWNAS